MTEILLWCSLLIFNNFNNLKDFVLYFLGLFKYKFFEVVFICNYFSDLFHFICFTTKATYKLQLCKFLFQIGVNICVYALYSKHASIFIKHASIFALFACFRFKLYDLISAFKSTILFCKIELKNYFTCK
jgi:hypothetical protein